MTRESALLYFDIPMRNEYLPLLNEAARILASCYKDLTKPHDELWDMPAMVMEAILCGDDVRETIPYLNCAKLRQVLACEDLDHDFAKDVVGDALFFKHARCSEYFTWESDRFASLRNVEKSDPGQYDSLVITKGGNSGDDGSNGGSGGGGEVRLDDGKDEEQKAVTS
ncbi:hypothetical protein QJS10_CPA07g00276 [Acorus calamus]|uniref:Uncharacterized protein n=1 Tax=Acorus calamus TaxID=4465 RepID=A0AAV9EGM2_ACOCL|nr:hypothetical protein QJS10_CPA07g00276 [Acorus calamus]